MKLISNGKRVREHVSAAVPIGGGSSAERALKRRAATYPCTYDLGYVRQDVYACTRCSREGQFAGFCGGCKFACHGEHLECVVDLYSKRAFKCDCGNDRMINHCMLNQEKEKCNVDNNRVYDHNFVGLYCRCNRGYDAKLGDMSQCACCEDWFHAVCIKVPGINKKSASRALRDAHYEFMCRDCAKNLPLLSRYVPELGVYKPKPLTVKELPKSDRPDYCKAPNVTVLDMPSDVDYFWKPGFREHLCTCFDCEALYHAADLPYIADRRDYAPGSSAQEANLLDETADAQIIRDVLQETSGDVEKTALVSAVDGSNVGRAAASLQTGGVDDIEISEPRTNGPDKRQGPGLDSEGSSDDDSDADLIDEQQLRIQRRIRDFLQRTIESEGRTMTHGAIRAYLADLKAQLLANTGTS